MKVAILAGGRGTRLAEETQSLPKPLVEIGGRPILWHIMRYYNRFGMSEFFVALGYKKDLVTKYFLDLPYDCRSLTVRTRDGSVAIGRDSEKLDWTVHLVDTGLDTMTGGRIKRLAPYLGRETFMLTWCDGLSNVDLDALLAFHRRHGRLATVTAVRSPARYGHIQIDDGRVHRFCEKPAEGDGWINGAFFVLEPGVFDFIDGDDTQWEREPMERLAAAGELMAYRHEGFWQCMDTLKEAQTLRRLWDDSEAPWKIWE